MIAILGERIPDMRVVASAKLAAAAMVIDGRRTPAAQRHIRKCWHYHPRTQTAMIFTREQGYHSGGWWKNPDYERCFHLSLRMLAYDGEKPIALPYDFKLGQKWVEAFFGDDAKLTWHEGPFTEQAKMESIHHYRLFCDEAWKAFKPRGEVYSKDWTPADWHSFSDIHRKET